MTEGAGAVLGAVLDPILDPASRTWWPALLTAAAMAAWLGRGDLLAGMRRELGRWTHPSSRLDLQLLLGRQLLRLAGVLPEIAFAVALARGLVRGLDRAVGMPDLHAPAWMIAVVYSAALFVAWDASRYVVHRLMHGVPPLWQLHQVHHSAQVLTPLTFHRIHPLESLLFQVRGALVGGLLAGLFYWAFRADATVVTAMGVHAVGLVCNVVSGNLRHSHCWWSFGPRVEGWLLSPAQHQLHHSMVPDSHHANYGTWLAVWDRWAGTLVRAERPPEHFGLDVRNHGDHLVSAWLDPLRAIARGALPWLLLLVASAASAQEAEQADRDDPGESIVVIGEREKLRVAGSAHVIGEEELERHEYDDIHRVLGGVPGVYVRGEDGFGLRPNIGIRGANSDRSAKVTLLEDGVLLAPAPYAAPAAYYFPMSTRLVGVEVFKGPAATRHGPHTVGGAVNMRTRAPPVGTEAGVDAAVGPRGSYRAHVYGGTGTPTRSVVLEAAQVGSNGFKELDGGGPTGFTRGELMLKAMVGTDPARHTSTAAELKLGAAFERSFETYLGLHTGDYADNPYRRYVASSEGLMRWGRTQAELAWPVWVGDRLQVRTIAYHHYLQRSWTKLNSFAGPVDLHDLLQVDSPAGQSAVYLQILRGEEDSSTPDHTLLVGTNDRRFHALGLQSTAEHDTGAGPVRSQLQAGLRWHADIVDRVQTEDPFAMRSGALERTSGPTVTALDAHDEAQALAAHVHDDLELWDRLHLLPGARVEVIATRHVDDAVVVQTVGLPSAAVLVEVAPWLDVFGGGHRGFSPASPATAAFALPERAWSYEGGVRLGRSPGGPRAEAIGFFTDYADLTAQCTLSGGCRDDQLGAQFNAGAAWVYGAEGAVGTRILLPRRLSVPLAATYTWTRAEFRSTFSSAFPQFGAVSAGDLLPYLPMHQGSADLALAHPRFEVSARVSARSGMLDQAGPDPAAAEIGGRALVDLAAHAVLFDPLTAYATLTNAGGSTAVESLRPFGARPTAPRQLMVGLKSRLGGP